MMNKTNSRCCLFVLACLLSACAQNYTAKERKLLAEDIAALKEGQTGMQKDLAEIKKLIRPRQRPGPVEAVNKLLDVSDDSSKGARNSRVVLVEFTDYQCPYCARHTLNVFPKIVKNYIQTGKIRYVLKDFPLDFHPNAAKAAEAAHCAGDQGQYWRMHGQLFAHQKALSGNQLTRYAKNLGLKLPLFKTCLDGGQYTSKVKNGLAQGKKAGIRGTPSFLLGYLQANGTKIKVLKLIRGAQAFPAFQKQIDVMLASKN